MKNYDEAFGKFFDRLADAGINKSNTLFVFTVEEGDHFVGSQPTNPGCDGVNTPCTYSRRRRDQRQLDWLAGHPAGDHDAVHRSCGHGADDLPHRQPVANQLPSHAPSAAPSRQAHGSQPLHWPDGYPDAALADPVAMDLLHMVTADPQRTPTLAMFAQPDYFLFTGAANCTSPCITVPTTPADVHVRVEPRRHPAGDRDDLARDWSDRA